MHCFRDYKMLLAANVRWVYFQKQSKEGIFDTHVHRKDIVVARSKWKASICSTAVDAASKWICSIPSPAIP